MRPSLAVVSAVVTLLHLSQEQDGLEIIFLSPPSRLTVVDLIWSLTFSISLSVGIRGYECLGKRLFELVRDGAAVIGLEGLSISPHGLHNLILLIQKLNDLLQCSNRPWP